LGGLRETQTRAQIANAGLLPRESGTPSRKGKRPFGIQGQHSRAGVDFKARFSSIRNSAALDLKLETALKSDGVPRSLQGNGMRAASLLGYCGRLPVWTSVAAAVPCHYGRQIGRSLAQG